MSLLKPKKKEFYLAISEGELGLEFFDDLENLKKLSVPHKRMITTFLLHISKQLSDEDTIEK